MSELQQQYPPVPSADSANNTTFADVIGGKTDTGAGNSIYTYIAKVYNHLFSSSQFYGLTTNNLLRGSLSPVVITGGSDAYGTELQIYDGTSIESGSSTKRFDVHELMVTAVGTANRPTFIEFYYGSQGNGVECTFTNGTEKVNKVAHGLSDGDKIMFSNSGGALPAELNNYTTYYVVNKADDDFELSLTSGGGTINFTDDGTGTSSYHVLTQTLLTEQIISSAATTSDASPYSPASPAVLCNTRLWSRAKASGGTNAVSFFLGVHTYTN